MSSWELYHKTYDKITASTKSDELDRLRFKARLEEAQALYHAEQVGMEKGIEQGILEGREQGISERNAEIASNLIQMGMSVEKVSQATDLTLDELRHLNT